jgi:hypothetical protein
VCSSDRTIGKRFDPSLVRSVYERNRLLFHWKNLTSRRLMARHLFWLPPRIAWALVARHEFLIGFVGAVPKLGAARRERAELRASQQRTDEEILRAFERPPIAVAAGASDR